MSDFWYDFVKDLVVPGLAGIGSILVGIGALVVADRSNGLAAQVRDDEQKREDDAAKERYRDQLFRSLEPAMTALLDHRGAVNTARGVGSSDERNLRSNATVRLKLTHVVANADDRRIIDAAMSTFIASNKTKHWQVVGSVAGEIALILANLLQEHDVDEQVKKMKDVLPKAVTRWATPATPSIPPAP